MATENERTFAGCLKRIRLAHHSKQVWLSCAVGCSDAAVSFWESGARVPSAKSMRRLLTALAEEGSPTSDLVELRRVWLDESTRRRVRPSPAIPPAPKRVHDGFSSDPWTTQGR
jgi:transcriptional regulator with XRE-family HTH domain